MKRNLEWRIAPPDDWYSGKVTWVPTRYSVKPKPNTRNSPEQPHLLQLQRQGKSNSPQPITLMDWPEPLNECNGDLTPIDPLARSFRVADTPEIQTETTEPD